MPNAHLGAELPSEHLNDVNARYRCNCGSGKFKQAQYDAQNIFLTYTCEDCHKQRMSGYRHCILNGYTQADVDEPIEPDGDW